MGFDELTTWMYSDGDILMFTAKILTLIFCLETFAYFISIVAALAKSAAR